MSREKRREQWGDSLWNMMGTLAKKREVGTWEHKWRHSLTPGKLEGRNKQSRRAGSWSMGQKAGVGFAAMAWCRPPKQWAAAIEWLKQLEHHGAAAIEQIEWPECRNAAEAPAARAQGWKQE